jgi:hypothetical protein
VCRPVIRRRREPRSGGRFVVLKTAIFFLGAGIWVAGVMLEDTRVTAAAIVLLAAGVVLRVLPSRRGGDAEEHRDGEPAP